MTDRSHHQTGTLDPKLLEILVCPLTKAPLEYDAEAQELISRQAGLAYPIRELFLRVAAVRGFWGYFLPLLLMMSLSLLYELIEWAAALVFGGDVGIHYLGTQGDVWDAHKDMALASLGALVAMTVTAMLNVWLQHDFAEEWNESLRIKHKLPLGEDEIARMLRRTPDRC